jgi:hypothetical protein
MLIVPQLFMNWAKEQSIVAGLPGVYGSVAGVGGKRAE